MQADQLISLEEDYWQDFKLKDSDVEFLYNHLLELETPLTPREMAAALVRERIRKRLAEVRAQRMAGGELYQPKGNYVEKQTLIFPALGWQRGQVVGVRPGKNPETGQFTVIQVKMEDGAQREFAADLPHHKLNEPQQFIDEDIFLDEATILLTYGDQIAQTLEEGLRRNKDFVRIAGRWFPRALLININEGHLNIAEAVLDMAGGKPLPTSALLEQIELPANVNPKLVEFSMDLALQEDARFDEVGPAGDVLWFLRRLEPPEVLETPLFLHYQPLEHDRSVLTADMLALETALDDELSPIQRQEARTDEVEIRLIYPHWRVGSLPLSSRLQHLFPTAYEAPRIRFILVDGQTGEKFPGWVVREKKYVFGLKRWYEKHGLIPGSIITIRRGANPGEVVVDSKERRSIREWIRTVLVGSDGGIVFAMLKQVITSHIDEFMAIAVPDVEGVDAIWQQQQGRAAPFDKTVVNIVRELAKLNPQGHAHASEIYAALNVVRRCPPAPILSLLISNPWFTHVGDLHFRLSASLGD